MDPGFEFKKPKVLKPECRHTGWNTPGYSSCQVLKSLLSQATTISNSFIISAWWDLRLSFIHSVKHYQVPTMCKAKLPHLHWLSTKSEPYPSLFPVTHNTRTNLVSQIRSNPQSQFYLPELPSDPLSTHILYFPPPPPQGLFSPPNLLQNHPLTFSPYKGSVQANQEAKRRQKAGNQQVGQATGLKWLSHWSLAKSSYHRVSALSHLSAPYEMIQGPQIIQFQDSFTDNRFTQPKEKAIFPSVHWAFLPLESPTPLPLNPTPLEKPLPSIPSLPTTKQVPATAFL